jgi:hypothetical protein
MKILQALFDLPPGLGPITIYLYGARKEGGCIHDHHSFMVGRALDIVSRITAFPAEVQGHSCLPIPFSGVFIIRSIRLAVFSRFRHVRGL